MKIIKYNGIYRAKVLDNYDPLVLGRVKLGVSGVYPVEIWKTPENLPWAEPVLSLFGGNYDVENSESLNSITGSYGKGIGTGITTIPHIGAELWVFFENGNQNYPKYFGACQGGEGWHSEHKNQHTIKTDNVTLIIDEEPTLPSTSNSSEMWFVNVSANIDKFSTADNIFSLMQQEYKLYKIENNDKKIIYIFMFNTEAEANKFKSDWTTFISDNYTDTSVVTIDKPYKQTIDIATEISTNKFNSNNSNCTHLSQYKQKLNMPTRVNIQINNTSGCALNLIINGDTNIKITGDVFEEINGNKHETLIGNLYRKHVGDLHNVHVGSEMYERYGKYSEISNGSDTITHDGNVRQFITGDDRKLVLGHQKTSISGQVTHEYFGSKMETVAGQKIDTTLGSYFGVTSGEFNNTAYNIYNVANDVSNIYNSLRTFTKQDIIEASAEGYIYSQSFADHITASTTGNIYRQVLGCGLIADKAIKLMRIGKCEITDTVDVSQNGFINHDNQTWISPVQ